ncbi:MAG: AarF/ABC1/UbiB kinase family protein [Pseudomonadota bacterium]
MRLGALPQTYRSIRRLQRIISVLVKYGFDDIIERLNLAGKNPLPFLRRHSALRGLTSARRLKLVLEELGPTFIKFGQVLSTRDDLLPPEFVAEFQQLQDKVPPMPPSEVRRALESALGAPLEEMFADFTLEARAAASIAQVHEATLKCGRAAVVKLQRPYIERMIDDDCGVLRHLAALMERHGLARDIGARRLVEQFHKNIRKELDFTLEGQNMNRFRSNFQGSMTFRVPEVIWSHSHRRVLTLERIEGIKISERARLEAEGYDPPLLATRLVEVMARQVVEFGLFHADPHPGNVFVLPGNVICLLDYGLVGRIDDDLIHDLIRLSMAVVRRDGEAMVRALFSIGVVGTDTNLRALKLDLIELVDRFHGMPLAQINIQAVFERFMAVVRNHHIAIPPELLLLAKAMGLIQSVARGLDPTFEPVAVLSPLINDLAAARLNMSYWARRARNYVEEVADVARELPREARSLLRKLQQNQLVFNFEHRGLERLTDEMDRSSNRISFSMIISALIVGSSIVVQTHAGPKLWGFPLLGLVGFLFAAFLGFWLAIAILKSGRL